MDESRKQWVDRAVRRLHDRGVPITRSEMVRIIDDLAETARQALRLGDSVRLLGIILHPDGTGELR